MKKTPVKPIEIDEDEPQEAEYNAIDEEALPGESMDDFMERRDAQEAEWKGKQGGQGASKHDANESRKPFKVTEEWDPHLGNQ